MENYRKLGRQLKYSSSEQDEQLLELAHKMIAEHGAIMVSFHAPGEEPRTLDQNAYLWEMMTQIGKHCGADAETTCYYLLDECYGQRKEVVNGREVWKRARTSRFSKRVMRDFLEWCLAWAAEHGAPVMMPPEYNDWAES